MIQHRQDHLSVTNLTLMAGQHCLFDHLSLNIPKNKWTAILGPSGVGKSTLLNWLSAQLNSVSYMTQKLTLMPWLSAVDNVLLGYTLRGKKNKALKEEAISLLEFMGLGQKLNAKPSELSGGMQQRVVLARTLLEKHDTILMDEPFSALDIQTKQALQQTMLSCLNNKTVIFVTHDPIEAWHLADNVFIFSDCPVQVQKQAVSQEITKPRASTGDVFHEFISGVVS